MSANVIARLPPRDGQEWECQCAHCGSSMTWEDCGRCGGEGYIDRSDEDPLWYTDDEPCPECLGTGRWPRCLSSYGVEDEGDASWCETHPLPGRERIWGPEWYVARAVAGGGT